MNGENPVRTLTYREWCNEAAKLFGPKGDDWRFKCPVCGHVASVKEWKAAGAENAAAFSCLGRWVKGVGCDYAGGGLFKLNPVRVITNDGNEHQMFEFAAAAAVEAKPC